MKTNITPALLTGAVALLSTPNLEAQTCKGPQPSNICTRPCWVARAPNCSIYTMGALNRATVHHTANAGQFGTASLNTSKGHIRGDQNYHMDVQGWCDLGYQFMVDKLGNIFEGRKDSMTSLRRGIHDACNTDSFGFTMMGYFHPPYGHVPPAIMMSRLYDVIAWRMPAGWSPYGTSSYCYGTMGVLDGHRNVRNTTACPGDVVYNNYITGNRNGGAFRDGVAARRCGASEPPPPSVVDRINVFFRGTDNALRNKYWINGSWGGPDNLGGTMTSDPSGITWNDGGLNIFYRGSDGALWHTWWTGSVWGGPQSLGGALAANSSPSAVGWGNGNITIFYRGSDNALWHHYWYNGAWGTHVRLGDAMTADPAAISWNGDMFNVFYRGSNNGLWYRHWNGSAWQTAQSLGGSLAAGAVPSLISWDNDKLNVFYRASDNALKYRYWSGSAWAVEYNLGGSMASNPSAVAWGDGKINVFFRGTDSTLRNRHWHGTGWYAEESLGGTIASDPKAVPFMNGFDVFYRGTDNTVYYQYWSGSAWSGPIGIATSSVGNPSVVTWAD